MDLAARKLVVFDWDGTLCDSMQGIIATARSVLLEWGIAEKDLGDLTRLVGPPFPQAYSWVYGLSAEDAAEVTPEMESVLNADPEELISRILAYYRDGARGEPVVPEKLLDASPENRRIMELLRRICQ